MCPLFIASEQHRRFGDELDNGLQREFRVPFKETERWLRRVSASEFPTSAEELIVGLKEGNG